MGHAVEGQLVVVEQGLVSSSGCPCRLDWSTLREMNWFVNGLKAEVTASLVLPSLLTSTWCPPAATSSMLSMLFERPGVIAGQIVLARRRRCSRATGSGRWRGRGQSGVEDPVIVEVVETVRRSFKTTSLNSLGLRPDEEEPSHRPPEGWGVNRQECNRSLPWQPSKYPSWPAN